MTAPRTIVPGATTAITRRTTLRKAFLAPWDPGVQQAWLYALAYAQRSTAVAIHHATTVITHHHLSVTPEKDNLPEFLRLLHHDVSCALNTLLARERYDQPGELFDDRSTHLMRLCDAPAQSTHLLYEYLNTVAAGLVDRPEHMPGYVFDFELWQRGSIEVRRPDFYFGNDRPEVLRLEVTPPPLLYAAFDGDMRALSYQMSRLADEAARELRAQRMRPALGARRIQRMHPWNEPRTLRESRGKRLPTFRIGARGVAGNEHHIEAAQETTAFRHGYHEALQARRGGDLCAVFPYGTYQMRVAHDVPVSAPPELGGGIVCRPGPLLRDVQAALEEARAERGGRSAGTEERFELAAQTREALRLEAPELCEHAREGMDFEAQPANVASARSRNSHSTEAAVHVDDVDAPVVTRHRFARPRQDDDRSVRRIVTLRDRRTGRPTSGRHGTDPPA